ncbi:MAG: SMC-Scp complex subunit ScpB [Candidatus Diapherotrites archaeon]|nr:SMC-Scp complex subunit ScpB [Candidatus Diapherotrites archaeon]
MMLDPKRVAEAALFMSSEPLTLDQLTKIMGFDNYGKALAVLDALVKEFNDLGAAMEIVRTPEGRYRMQVRDELLQKVQHLAVSTDLSRAVLRTLAIIAFKQPVRQSIVVKMRGNKAYDHIKELSDKGFVRGVKEGNTISLETTKKFEEYFGSPIKDTEFVIKHRGEQTTLLGMGDEIGQEEEGAVGDGGSAAPASASG